MARLKKDLSVVEEKVEEKVTDLPETPETTDATKGDEMTEEKVTDLPEVTEVVKEKVTVEYTDLPNGVLQVFDKFAVEVDGKVKLFDELKDAIKASISNEAAAVFNDRINAYFKAREIDGKSRMGVGRSNLLKDFLIFEASI